MAWHGISWTVTWAARFLQETPGEYVGGGLGKMSADDIKRHSEALEWRVLDDDGEVYAKGMAVGDLDGEDAFSPLDDWAEGMFGATSIQYKRNGVWQTL